MQTNRNISHDSSRSGESSVTNTASFGDSSSTSFTDTATSNENEESSPSPQGSVKKFIVEIRKQLNIKKHNQEKRANASGNFDTVCAAAENQDKYKLNSLHRRKYNIHMFNKDGMNPIMFLAKKGDLDAVLFLFFNYNGNINQAIEGAARGKHLKLVKRLLNYGGSINYAVRGAAYANHTKLVRKLLRMGASPEMALAGATRGGHFELQKKLKKQINNKKAVKNGRKLIVTRKKVKAIIEFISNGGIPHEDFDKHLRMVCSNGLSYLTSLLLQLPLGDNQIYDAHHKAIKWAMEGEQFQLVNLLLDRIRAKNPFIEAAAEVVSKKNIKKYAESEYTLLKFCSFFDDQDLRKLLIEKIIARAKETKSPLGNVDKNEIAQKAASIHGLMKDHQINFDKALSIDHLMSQEALNFNEADARLLAGTIWILQGSQLVTNEELPIEIFSHITSFVVGSSSSATNKIIDNKLKQFKKYTLFGQDEQTKGSNDDDNNNNNNTTHFTQAP